MYAFGTKEGDSTTLCRWFWDALPLESAGHEQHVEVTALIVLDADRQDISLPDVPVQSDGGNALTLKR